MTPPAATFASAGRAQTCVSAELSWRAYLFIFATAAGLRLVNMWSLSGDPTLFAVEDSSLYWRGADILREYGTFATDANGVFTPQTERVPAYFLFLAATQTLSGGSIHFSVGCQALLDAASCALIARLATLISPRVGMVAGILAALWPNLIVHSSQLLTDSLFLFLLCCSMLLFTRFVRRPAALNAGLLGLILGMLVMTRVTAQFAPPVIAILCVILAVRGSVSLAGVAAIVVAFTIGLALPTAHLVSRNITQFDSFALTAQGGTHLLYWVLPRTRAIATGAPAAQTIEQLDAQVDQQIDALREAGKTPNAFALSALRTRVALDGLRQTDVTSILKAWLIGAVRTLATPAILHDLRVRRLSNASLASTAGSTFFERAHSYVTNNSGLYQVLALGGILGAGICLLLQLYGAITLALRNAHIAVAAMAPVVYFLILNGPVGDAKYRLPLEPILIGFTALALVDIAARFTARRAQ